MVLRCKRIHKPEQTLSRFSQIFLELWKSNVQLGSTHGNFTSGVSNSKIVFNFTLIVPKLFAFVNSYEDHRAIIESSYRKKVICKSVEIPCKYRWRSRRSSFACIFHGFCQHFICNLLFYMQSVSKFPANWAKLLY